MFSASAPDAVLCSTLCSFSASLPPGMGASVFSVPFPDERPAPRLARSTCSVNTLPDILKSWLDPLLRADLILGPCLCDTVLGSSC